MIPDSSTSLRTLLKLLDNLTDSDLTKLAVAIQEIAIAREEDRIEAAAIREWEAGK